MVEFVTLFLDVRGQVRLSANLKDFEMASSKN